MLTTQIEQADRDLLDQAATWACELSVRDLTATRLLAIANEHESDFATAVAYQCLRRDPAHAPTIERIERASILDDRPTISSAMAFGLIPNLGYAVDQKSQQAGALMMDAAKKLGLQPFVVPLDPRGDLNSNARVVCDTLTQRSEERIILVSISKGSADLKVAFAQRDAPVVFRRVVAWINACGLLDGTLVVNTLLDQRNPQIEAQILNWFRRRGESYVQHVIEAMRECGHGPGRPLDFPLAIPPHVSAYHVAAFPLERHFLYDHARFLNQILLQFGPNDGFALLADLLNKPGIVFPIWGSDHYIDQSVNLERLVRALLRVICEDAHLLPS